MTDPRFLLDEVRCGFMIPTAVKQAWAGSLAVLKEVDRICEKYGINYYAEWGTLLGAVRHAGFVPWDDDLDIGMLRSDYNKFREVADKELPSGFMIQDYASLDDYRQFIVRVTASERINFSEEHLLEFNNFPYIASIDIFVSDYLYRDEDKERERDREVLKLIALSDGIRDGEIVKDTAQRELYDIGRKYGVRFPEFKKKREVAVLLYRLAEEQMGRVRREDADETGQIFPWILKGGKGVDRGIFEEFVRLPFEDTTIPVPAQYAKMTGRKYGDFMKVSKIWGGHGYPFFEAQKEAFEASAGVKLPAFKYEPGMEVRSGTGGSLKEIAKECVEELNRLYEAFPEDYYAASQQLAIDLGTLTEQVYGEDFVVCRILIPALEAFCEQLYAAAAEGGRVDTAEVSEAVRSGLLEYKEVLFVTYDADAFEDMREIYGTEKEKGPVTLIRLPVWKKDPLGRILADIDAGKDPENVTLTAYDTYDPVLRAPSKIYINWPYDNENPVLTVPADYFSGKLHECTEELIYVTPRKIRDFGADEKNDVYNMKHYICAPGPICADRVIVWSEVLKERYAEALCAFMRGADEAAIREKIKLYDTENKG